MQCAYLLINSWQHTSCTLTTDESNHLVSSTHENQHTSIRNALLSEVIHSEQKLLSQNRPRTRTTVCCRKAKKEHEIHPKNFE